MRVCLFGAYDPEYPRVRVFREARKMGLVV